MRAPASIGASIQNLFLSGSCYADCDDNGALAVADFTCFQNRFVIGSSYADCDSSGTHTIADFTCFQNAFAAGCP